MRDCFLVLSAICITTFGEEVRITGNHPELGGWDRTRSLVLTTNINDYPIWKSSRKIRIR